MLPRPSLCRVGVPLVRMAMVSGANGDPNRHCRQWCSIIHWRQWPSPSANIGTIIIELIDPLDGDTPFTITTQSEWMKIWNWRYRIST